MALASSTGKVLHAILSTVDEIFTACGDIFSSHTLGVRKKGGIADVASRSLQARE